MFKLLQKDWQTLSLDELRKVREGVDDVLTRKWFVNLAYAVYGGSAGLYDLGPPGCEVKNNLISRWREHFVLEEDMLEIETPSVTPQNVLRASGHEKKFSDLLVKERDGQTSDEQKKVVTKGGKRKADPAKGSGFHDCWRLDHYFEDWAKQELERDISDDRKAVVAAALANSANLVADEWKGIFRSLGVLSPNGLEFDDPVAFNLMFRTQVGAFGDKTAYLRPETAQGIFVNFHRAFQYQGSRLPFAVAQVGAAFRNEISPRSGLLRVREFPMAEIEHFLDGDKTQHPKFETVAGLRVPLLPKGMQGAGRTNSAIRMTLGEAVSEMVVCEDCDGQKTQLMIHDETLAYFMGRTFLFLTKIGLDPARLRFRQHQATEMAHYANDCWDLEAFTTYGWVELVGHANRGSYDLAAHARENTTGTDLSASVVLDEPIIKERWKVSPNMKSLGRRLRAKAKIVGKHLESLADKDEEAEDLARMLAEGMASICVDGESFEISKSDVAVSKESVKVTVEHFFPRVVEPSFGIGRIMHTLFEHSFYVRESDEQRCVLRLPAISAPWKAALLPLSANAQLTAAIPDLRRRLKDLNISHRVDASGTSIGRRYARMDEFGIPFAITVDFDTVETSSKLFGTVTLRERDSCEQIRGPIAEITHLVADLASGRTLWRAACERFPLVHQAE